MNIRKVQLYQTPLTDNQSFQYAEKTLLGGQSVETVLRLTATVTTSGTAPVGGSGSLLDYITRVVMKGTHKLKGTVTLFDLSPRELYEYAHVVTKTYNDKADAGFAINSTYNVLVEIPLMHALKDIQGGYATILDGFFSWNDLEVDVYTGSISNMYTTVNGATISSQQLTIKQERITEPLVEYPPVFCMVKKLAKSTAAGAISPESVLQYGKIRGYLLHTQASGVDSDSVLGDVHIIENGVGASIFDAESFGALKSNNKRHFKLENLSTGMAMIDFTSSEFLPTDFKNGYDYAQLDMTGTILNTGNIYIIPMFVV